MTRGFLLGLLGLAAIFAGQTAHAAEAAAPEKTDRLFCDKIEEEVLYDKHHFESYKMLAEGANGWIFRSQSDFRTDFSLPQSALEDLKALNEGLMTRDMELVVLLTPTRGLMHAAYISDEDKDEYGLDDIDSVWQDYWNAVDSIRDQRIHVVGIDRLPPEQSFFYQRDHHWNPDGARLAANAVADYIRKMPDYARMEKTAYATKELGSQEIYGVSKKVFKKLCDTQQPPEYIKKYVTERLDATAGHSDLFGKVKVPSIVLLGTSNSTMEPSFANFEGFLKEALQTDVLNMSVSGGGLDTAMLTYLNSDYYEQDPAKIALWEIPSYYNIAEHKSFFREAIPAAYGQCDANPVARNEGYKIDEKSVIALEKLAGKKISGADYYLRVAFSAPLQKSFSVDFRYRKDRDRYKFLRGAHSSVVKSHYVSLNPEKKDHLDKVILTLPAEAKGLTMDVSLCKKDKNLRVAQKDMEPQAEADVRGGGKKSLFQRVKDTISHN